MIDIHCTSATHQKLSGLTRFQGSLKKRTRKDVQALAQSLKNEGLIMPFVVWIDPYDNVNLLDGHGRLAALTELALEDNSIAEQDFPVIYVNAADENIARQYLLQINSVYGRMTREGVAEFTRSIPDYKAPAIAKFSKAPVKKHVSQATAIIRLKVPADKEEAVRRLLSTVEYITVLA